MPEEPSVADQPDFAPVYEDDDPIQVRKGDLQALLDLAVSLFGEVVDEAEPCPRCTDSDDSIGMPGYIEDLTPMAQGGPCGDPEHCDAVRTCPDCRGSGVVTDA